MAKTAIITDLRDDMSAEQKTAAGVGGQVMLVKTETFVNQGVNTSVNNTELYDTVAQAETAKTSWLNS